MIANTLQAEKCSTLNATVNSYNEWDPLEEVIVGSLDNAVFPPNHLSVNATIPQSLSKILMLFGSRRYPKFLIEEASKDLEHFIHILESEGVTECWHRVRRKICCRGDVGCFSYGISSLGNQSIDHRTSSDRHPFVAKNPRCF